MKKALTKYCLKILFLSLLFGFNQYSFASQNKFCLESDGYITPIIPNDIFECNEIIKIK